jgi:hypothetical protein
MGYQLLLKGAAFLFLLVISGEVRAWQPKILRSLKDSVDKAFDLSDYIIDKNGFVPIPILVTEPALGGIGGGIIPVFMKKNAPFYDTIKGKPVKVPVAPDITGGIGLYTANDTWLTFLFRSGTLIKSRIKYIMGGGYANVNLSFYRDVEGLGEKEFKINIATIPVRLQAIKKIPHSYWYAGFRYSFLNTKVGFRGDSLHSEELVPADKLNTNISQLGVIVEMDKRDNIFSPNKGMKLHFDAIVSDKFLGSDYDFWQLDYYGYGYQKLGNKIVSGLRIDGQQAFGDPPFFVLPYISMRGIPAVRYQGKTALLSEGEVRWDFYRRWSMVAFGGAGKAFNEWTDWKTEDWVGSYGSGFRYLLARKFRLRVGIDVAKGPETWAWYIIFGSSWLK